MTDQRTEELSPLKRAIVEIRDLKARLADTEARAHEPIAVIGMGMRLPGGANDPESFWRLLYDGVDAITEVPAERWSIDELYDPDPEVPGRMAIRHGGFLRGVDEFDAAFFGISPREAETIDPQQRLLLEVTWEALEHAGIAPDRLFGGSAGVFVGISNSDHYRLLLADRDQIDTYTTTGNAPRSTSNVRGSSAWTDTRAIPPARVSSSRRSKRAVSPCQTTITGSASRAHWVLCTCPMASVRSPAPCSGAPSAFSRCKRVSSLGLRCCPNASQ